jgi:hypothetical protein
MPTLSPDGKHLFPGVTKARQALSHRRARNRSGRLVVAGRSDGPAPKSHRSSVSTVVSCRTPWWSDMRLTIMGRIFSGGDGQELYARALRWPVILRICHRYPIAGQGEVIACQTVCATLPCVTLPTPHRTLSYIQRIDPLPRSARRDF